MAADHAVPSKEKLFREMAAELENSLYARCESCCKGIAHDDVRCGAPTARRLLARIGRVGRRALASPEKPDAKFQRIAGEIKANADWRALLAGTYADETRALEEIAQHYSGENTATGGGIYVVLIPLGPHDCMGITAEVVCRYSNLKATSMEQVFWEPTNDTSEGCVSLVEDAKEPTT